MSDEMIKYYYQYDKPENLTQFWAKHLYEQNKNNKTFHFKEDEILEAFIESIKTQTKLVSDVSFLDIENFMKSTTEKLSIDIRNELKFSREQWDPTLKSDQYLFMKPNSAVDYFVNKCNSLIKKLKEYRNQLEIFNSANILGFKTKLQAIDSIIKTIDSITKNLEVLKSELLKNKDQIQQNIAYLCGIWNGIIEFLAGIIDIILLAVTILSTEFINDIAKKGIYLDLLEIREGVEESISTFLQYPGKMFEEVFASLKNYKYSRYDDPELNQYQIRYHEGEDTILGIDIVITIVTIIKGIAKLAKLLPKFTKWVDDVLELRKSRKILRNLERLESAWQNGWSKEKSSCKTKRRKTISNPMFFSRICN